MSWPSGAPWPASSSAAASGPVEGTSKIASTEADSAPVRMRSGWARAPRTRRRASMTMDLPAPVCPVRTLRPGPKTTRASSTTARFRIASSRSMAAPMLDPRRGGVQTVSQRRQRPVGAAIMRTNGLPLSPLELGPEDREEVLLGKAEESDSGRRLVDGDHVTLLQREADLSVQRDHDVLIRLQGHLDALIRGKHDRPVGQGVRADRRQHHRGHRGEDDGAARGERVGGGPGGSGDNQPIRPIASGELPVHGDSKVDDPTHGGLGDDHVVEGDILREPLAVTPDLRRQHHALLDEEPTRQEGFQGREELVNREGGEEAEATQIDAEDGHAEVAHQPRHREEGAVAAEDQDEIDLAREIGFANCRGPRVGAEPRCFLLEERLQVTLFAPGEQPLDDAAGLGAICLGDDTDSLHAGSGDSAARVIRLSRSVMVRPVRVRWRKNSRLPFGPLRGDGVTPRTCQPCRTENLATREMTVLWWLASRTTPPLPTSPLPISNCGLMSTTISPSEVRTLKTEGITFSTEIKDTSTVARCGASGKASEESCRALVFSMTTTRPSARREASSWPCPTSTAYTRVAPASSRHWVKPPVAAPTSRHTRCLGETANASSACESLSPPRLTNFCFAVSRSSAPGATSVPGLSTRLPSTVTAPAKRRRAAFSRLSHSPRATRATSMRSLTFACPAGAGPSPHAPPRDSASSWSPSSRNLLSPARDAVTKVLGEPLRSVPLSCLRDDVEDGAIGIGDRRHPVLAHFHPHTFDQLDVAALGRLDESAHHRTLALVGARYLEPRHVALGHRACELMKPDVEPRHHLEDPHHRRHAVEGGVEAREDEPTHLLADQRDVGRERRLGESAGGAARPGDLETMLGRHALDGAGGGDGHHDATGRARPHHEQGDEGEGEVAGEHLPFFVHEEHLFAARVEQHAQIGPQSPHDVRELLEGPLELFRGFRDARLVQVRVEGDHLNAERAKHRGEDRRGGAEGVVEDHPQAAAPNDLAIDGSEEAVAVAIGAGVREGQGADAVHGSALEVFHEEEPLHGLLPVRRHLEPPRVEKLDIEDLGVVGGLPHMSASGQSQRRDLIADHGNGRHSEILHVDAHGEQAGHQRAIDHAGRLVVIAACDHDPSAANDGSAGRAELGRELWGDFDVGETGDAVPTEERTAPPLAPDQAHGKGGAVLDLLVGPDLDVGLDDAGLADPTKVGDDHPFGQEGVGPDHGLPADDGLFHDGAGTDLDAVPYHAALHVGTRLDDGIRSYDRVGHPGAWCDQGSPTDDHGAGQARRIDHPGSRVQPHRMAVARVALAGYVDSHPALEEIQVSRAVLGEIAHVAPVTLGHVAPE